MQTDYLDETVLNENLRVFALYADVEASERARKVARVITKLASQHWRASSQTWNLDSLITNQPIGKLIANDAATADVLVIAISSLEHRPLNLIHWLDSLPALKRGRSFNGLLIGLLGDEEDQSQELIWTVEQLMRCARKTNRDFTWHWMDREAMDDLGWLNENGEKMLARKRSWHEQIASQELTLCCAPHCEQDSATMPGL